MLHIWTDKIKNSTVGSSFSVTFSVPSEELPYLMKLYDTFKNMHMSSFPVDAYINTLSNGEEGIND